MEKRAYSIARIFIFFFSIAFAYALWTYLRPRFVTPKTSETNTLTEQESQLQEITTQDSTIEPALQTDTPKAIATQTTATTITTETKNTPDKATKPSSTATPTATAPLTMTTKTSTAKKNLPANRTITIHNGIEKKMLGYKKFGTHYPTSFKLLVGSTVIEQNSSTTALIKNNELVVQYNFEFMNGYRKGAKEVTFTLKPETESISLGFNWKGSPRLYAEADKVISTVEKEIPYQA